jgi:hypothetical protein
MSLLKEQIDSGCLVVVKNFMPANEILRLKKYLSSIMMSTMPEFVPILKGAKNNFRINLDDERAQVKAWFYVWSFFTWNQDLFNLYKTYAPIYHLRNILAGLPEQTFLSRSEEMGCAARLSVQFYPSGKGYFTEHVDPYDKHQLVVPIMAMSKTGEDFSTGGNFVQTTNGQRLITEQFLDLCPHGVATVDEEVEYDPLSTKGRWMMLFAVNKTANNTLIANAQATIS